jgi:adenylosuccinate lyase
LLSLVDKGGMSREDAYTLVQRNAHAAWNTKDGNFKINLLADAEVMKHLDQDDVEQCFNPAAYLRNVDRVFERLGI